MDVGQIFAIIGVLILSFLLLKFALNINNSLRDQHK